MCCNNSSTDFLTVVEASAKLGISKETLRNYLSKGKIKGYKKFGRWYVFPSDLTDFLKAK